ncbi:YbaB/EbfC family nucleoid-associated protein [Saccharopolyspora sp. 5N708]|uniref:YbaB/EbfC family nucleoid-associated protein n=1 Tax=Saccharopolyspora sp. 5N708 TaxID=3457424 RepID=UPI003FD24A92
MNFDELDAEIERAAAEYQRQRAELRTTAEQLERLSVTVTSTKREVTVTVGPRGELRDLKFPTAAYRSMAPAELAALVLRTAERAREQAGAKVAELMGPMLPTGLSPQAIARGEGLPEDPRDFDFLGALRSALGKEDRR